jgi:hypothetical protein
LTGGTVLAGLLIAAMAALSVLHAYWGFGGVWPGTDAASLAQTVVGTRGGRMPGLGPSLFVAACLAAVAILIAWRAGLVPGLDLPSWLWVAGYSGALLVFAARGIAGFVPPVFRYAAGTPFERLNVALYSPLCLAIAAGMIALWWMARRT